MNNTISLRRRLLILVLAFWILPVAFLFFFLTISYRNDIINKTTVLMEESIKNFTYFNAQRIDEAIDLSKKTSYEQIIEKGWRNFSSGLISKAELYRQITGNLTSKFYNDNRFDIAVFYLSEEPERIYYTRQKESNYIDIYRTEVEEEANRISMQDSSDAHVRVINSRIYIIRNLYTTTNYTKFGTLILELNKEKLVDGIYLNTDYEMSFYINDVDSMITYDNKLNMESRSTILSKLASHYSKTVNRKVIQVKEKPFTGFLYQQKYDDFHIGAVLVANENVIFSELQKLYLLMVLISLVVIPIFIYMIYFISHHITKPMSRMIDAAKALEKGDIGMQISGSRMPNTEFYVLQDSFNKMSSEIKYLFDYAYSEKLARKDAKIIALQSRINPHFLNNTLEMMNWQARMAGDVTVSKMIEALGTLLNSSMDRSSKRLISLAEELHSVDAYCYIISMRFGKRLKIEKEIDDKLLQLKVPQLILQPLIENAVVHGVETIKSGIIYIRIFTEENNAVLQIVNTGKNLTNEDLVRIDHILKGKEELDPEKKAVHEAMGIHNVNERIKLIYGEKFGLTIGPKGEGETASTIILPLDYDPEMTNENLKKLMWNRLD